MGPVIANVTGTGTYEDGSIFVFFDRQISSCSGTTRVDLAANHDAKEQVLSIAMTAFVSGRMVSVHPGSCNGAVPDFGPTGDSYLYLTQ